MFKRRLLACSFCGRSATQVAKLVAGPKVYICDFCVAEASRIMNTPDATDTPRSSSKSVWVSLTVRLSRLLTRAQFRAA